MKNSLIILFTLFAVIVNAQSFSGLITYRITIIPKNNYSNLDEIIKSEHGEMATYLITSKYYKSSYFKNGKYSYSYTYHDESKRMYDDYSDRPYITFRDSRKANTKSYSTKIHKDSTFAISGHQCYVVTEESDHGKSRSYYSDDIKVNPEDFKGHEVGNWYKKLKEVNGAVLLKSVWEYDNYTRIQEAIKIENREVEKSEFDLPEGKEIVASASALDVKPELHRLSEKQLKCYRKKVESVSRPGGEKYTTYTTLLLNEKGKIEYIAPDEKDNNGFYKVAVEIFETCGIEFEPGKIDGKPVSSIIYFPVEFYK
jgi:hypothetical protein